VNRGPLDRLAVAASLVFIADFATKEWALRLLRGNESIATGWHLAVVNNTHLAGGVGSGGFELPLTAILTLVVAILVLRVCRPLAAIDSSAPITLGLLVGSGAANLADGLIPPSGVVDFIAYTGPGGDTISFNVADVVLVVGLALCLRMMWRLGQRIRGIPRPKIAAPRRPLSGALSMRDRLLVSAGHALLAMCGFVWLYSMAIAFTPDAGQSAPNSLLCGLAVFAIVFVASDARTRLLDQRRTANAQPLSRPGFERVVLDGSVPAMPLADVPITERPREQPRGDVLPLDDERARDQDMA
jgi:lipoprotein signal peptidase